MGQVYEDLYQHLISEGIDDSVATSVVNNMYDKEQYHNVEQLDEGAFRAASMIGKIAAKMMGFGKVSARAARGAGAQTLRTLNRRGSEAFQRGVRRRNWTPDKALSSKVTTGRGGALDKSLGGNLGPVPKIEKVKFKDLGSVPSSGGPTRYQGTRSGGQLGGSSASKSLPDAGQTASRRNTAAATAAAAAAGTTGTGVKTGTTSAIQLRKGLSDRVRRAKENLKRAKLPLAVGAGLAAGVGVASLTGGGNNKADTAPAAPKDNTLADKGDAKKPFESPFKVDMKFKGNVFTDEPKTDEPKTKDDATANVKAAYERGKPFDIRDRDVTARASYDPRLKSERERMKRIRAERKAAREKK